MSTIPSITGRSAEREARRKARFEHRKGRLGPYFNIQINTEKLKPLVKCTSCGACDLGSSNCICAALIDLYGSTCCAGCGYEYKCGDGMPVKDHTIDDWLSLRHKYIKAPCASCHPVYVNHLKMAAAEAWAEDGMLMERWLYWNK